MAEASYKSCIFHTVASESTQIWNPPLFQVFLEFQYWDGRHPRTSIWMFRYFLFLILTTFEYPQGCLSLFYFQSWGFPRYPHSHLYFCLNLFNFSWLKNGSIYEVTAILRRCLTTQSPLFQTRCGRSLLSMRASETGSAAAKPSDIACRADWAFLILQLSINCNLCSWSKWLQGCCLRKGCYP